MDVGVLQELLGWCTLINMGILMTWFLFFWLAHDWMYRLHGKMFKLSVETFDAIHYAGMAGFKICIFILNLGPFLSLLIMRQI